MRYTPVPVLFLLVGVQFCTIEFACYESYCNNIILAVLT
jgi:hypothetical protein